MAFGIGKGLNGTQTKGSTAGKTSRTPTNQSGGTIERGARHVPSGGAKLIGKGLSNSQTSGPRGNKP